MKLALACLVVFLLGCSVAANPEADARKNPLLAAAIDGDLRRLEAEISRGLDLDARDSEGLSALHWAARSNHVDCIRTLVKAGAPVNSVAAGGQRPIEFAFLQNSQPAVEALLESGADLGPSLMSRQPMLHIAVSSGHPEMVKLLLARGAAVNSVDSLGRTVLHNAVGRPEIIRLLLAAGADPRAKDENGNSVLHQSWWAAEVAESVQLLVKSGAEVNARDLLGSTPLFHAARSCSASAVETLLAAGADPNATNLARQTPLIAARHPQSGRFTSVSLFSLATTEKRDCSAVIEALFRAGAR